MLRIRLQRTGRKNFPHYRIVVAEHSSAAKGKCVEILGHYIPIRNPKVFEYNTEKIRYWISKGAKPSETLAGLLKKNGFNEIEKFIVHKVYQKKSKQAPKDEGKTVTTAQEPEKKVEENKENNA